MSGPVLLSRRLGSGRRRTFKLEKLHIETTQLLDCTIGIWVRLGNLEQVVELIVQRRMREVMKRGREILMLLRSRG